MVGYKPRTQVLPVNRLIQGEAILSTYPVIWEKILFEQDNRYTRGLSVYIMAWQAERWEFIIEAFLINVNSVHIRPYQFNVSITSLAQVKLLPPKRFWQGSSDAFNRVLPLTCTTYHSCTEINGSNSPQCQVYHCRLYNGKRWSQPKRKALH